MKNKNYIIKMFNLGIFVLIYFGGFQHIKGCEYVLKFLTGLYFISVIVIINDEKNSLDVNKIVNPDVMFFIDSIYTFLIVYVGWWITGIFYFLSSFKIYGYKKLKLRKLNNTKEDKND